MLIDGEENLIVLKKGSTEQPINVSEGYISEIANRVKLSSETILKVIGVMQTYGTAEITSQELMDALHISLRTANKFLSNLEKNGYAQVAGLKRSGNKGRPVNEKCRMQCIGREYRNPSYGRHAAFYCLTKCRLQWRLKLPGLQAV